jgi:hypothetical protein
LPLSSKSGILALSGEHFEKFFPSCQKPSSQQFFLSKKEGTDTNSVAFGDPFNRKNIGIPERINMIKNEDIINEDKLLKFYKERFRVLLIIYFFSEDYDSEDEKNIVKLLYGEIKIQAIDFFIRNPDYLANELLAIAENEPTQANDIKDIVKQIYEEKEPEIRRVEMEKFFFGAWEDIDDIVAFLISRGLIKYESKLRIDGRVAEKHYYITKKAAQRLEAIRNTSPAEWYFKRCEIIKRFLGNATGCELKAKQYQVSEYSSTPYKAKIKGIDDKVIDKFHSLFSEAL